MRGAIELNKQLKGMFNFLQMLKELDAHDRAS